VAKQTLLDQFEDRLGKYKSVKSLLRIFEKTIQISPDILRETSAINALVACEVVARLKGNRDTAVPTSEKIDQWIGKHDLVVSPQLVGAAIQALNVVMHAESIVRTVIEADQELVAVCKSIAKRLVAGSPMPLFPGVTESDEDSKQTFHDDVARFHYEFISESEQPLQSIVGILSGMGFSVGELDKTNDGPWTVSLSELVHHDRLSYAARRDQLAALAGQFDDTQFKGFQCEEVDVVTERAVDRLRQAAVGDRTELHAIGHELFMPRVISHAPGFGAGIVGGLFCSGAAMFGTVFAVAAGEDALAVSIGMAMMVLGGGLTILIFGMAVKGLLGMLKTLREGPFVMGTVSKRTSHAIHVVYLVEDEPHHVTIRNQQDLPFHLGRHVLVAMTGRSAKPALVVDFFSKQMHLPNP